MNARSLGWLAVFAVACSAPAPVDRAAWDRAASRLLQPFLTDKDVACGELVIDISPNFYTNVGQPTIDPKLHSARKEHGSGYDETIWLNRIGDLSGAFKITIGAPDEFTDRGIVAGKLTRFTVLHEVRLRVHTGTDIPVQLDAVASGQPLVVGERGSLRNLREWRVQDGQLHAQ